MHLLQVHVFDIIQARAAQDIIHELLGFTLGMKQVFALDVIADLFPENIAVALQGRQCGTVRALQLDDGVPDMRLAHLVEYTAGKLALLREHLDLLQARPLAGTGHFEGELIAVIFQQGLHQWRIHQPLKLLTAARRFAQE